MRSTPVLIELHTDAHTPPQVYLVTNKYQIIVKYWVAHLKHSDYFGFRKIKFEKLVWNLHLVLHLSCFIRLDIKEVTQVSTLIFLIYKFRQFCMFMLIKHSLKYMKLARRYHQLIKVLN